MLLKDVSKEDLTLTHSQDDLAIDIRDRGRLTLQGYYAAAENGVKRLETIEGPLYLAKDMLKEMEPHQILLPDWGWSEEADGLVYGNDQSNIIGGGRQNDVLFGVKGSDLILGREGNDTIVGGDGGDTLFGMQGHDTLYGDAGADTLWGGKGNDSLVGGLDRDVLDGDSGKDWLFGGAGNDALSGGEDADILDGGAGDDMLIGGKGDDTYRFRPGDGRDVIADSPLQWGSYGPDGGIDRIRFDSGVLRSDVAIFETGGDLQIQYGAGDLVNVREQRSAKQKVERFELADGSYLTGTDVNLVIQQMAAYAGQEGISQQSVEDVRRNEALMTIVAGAWRQA